jgi:hypothetical protein
MAELLLRAQVNRPAAHDPANRADRREYIFMMNPLASVFGRFVALKDPIDHEVETHVWRAVQRRSIDRSLFKNT